MTADHREQPLAALERIDDHTSHDDGYPEAQMTADLALIRAALTPALPADLAEIQARADRQKPRADWARERLGRGRLNVADRRVLVADIQDHRHTLGQLADALVAELRARPTLTAEQAATAVGWSEHAAAVWALLPEEHAARDALRAIAEGAGSTNSTTNHDNEPHDGSEGATS